MNLDVTAYHYLRVSFNYLYVVYLEFINLFDNDW